MVIVDGISKKGNTSKGGFMSFFNRFAGSRKGHIKTPTIITEVTKKEKSQDVLPSSMTLKLSSPSSGLQTEEPPQLLTDILMNEQLFEVFHGKSLILHAEVTVEKQLDGSPKSMIVSGQVPVTLSKGLRNGKPTREIRVRGHLRRKRSSEPAATTVPENLNSSDRLGIKSGTDWEVVNKYGLADRNRPHSRRKKAAKEPPHRPPEQAEFQTSSEFRTYSRLGASLREKKNNSDLWSAAGGSGFLDQENPTGIANWSPYFDCGSPMSGQTVRGNNRKYQENWDLREKTPIPRFSSTMATSNSTKKGRDKRSKLSSKKSSLTNNFRKGDWSPFINITSSSNSNRETKAELLQNKSSYSDENTIHPSGKTLPIQTSPVSVNELGENIEVGEGSRHPQVNDCLLIRSVLDNEKEDDACCRSLDEKGLSVARSESVASALREGKIHLSQIPQDEATQTNGHRRIEISKISHQVGERLNHLKKMVISPKNNSESPRNDKGTTHILSKILPKKFSKINESVVEDEYPACSLHKNVKSSVQENGVNTIDKLNREMESKLVQARSSSIDENTNKNRTNTGGLMAVSNKVLGNGEAGDECPCGEDEPIEKLKQETETKSVQARGNSIDGYLFSTIKSNGDHDPTTLGARTQEKTMVRFNRETESKLVQARGSSIDDHNRARKSNGDHIPETTGVLEKVRKAVHDKYTHLYKPGEDLVRETEDKLVQARRSSIDEHSNEHHLQTLGVYDKVQKMSRDDGDDQVKNFNNNQTTPLDKFNREIESKFVQARGRSIDEWYTSNGDRNESQDEYIHTRDTPLRKYNGEVENNQYLLNPPPAGGSLTEEYPQTTWSIGDHAREKLGNLEKKVKKLVNDMEESKNKYRQDSRGETQGKAPKALRSIQDQPYYAKKLNPITTITISRSRTKFFRYNNGRKYSTKEGAQVVTIEAPKGLLYSSKQ